MEVRTLKEIENSLAVTYQSSLTPYERISVAVQIQRNEILKAGLVVQNSGDEPTALEWLAIAAKEK